MQSACSRISARIIAAHAGLYVAICNAIGPRRTYNQGESMMARAWSLASRPHGMPTHGRFRADRPADSAALQRRRGPDRQSLAVGRSLYARPDERREELCRRPSQLGEPMQGGAIGEVRRKPRGRLRGRRHGPAYAGLARRGGAAARARCQKLPAARRADPRRFSASSACRA